MASPIRALVVDDDPSLVDLCQESAEDQFDWVAADGPDAALATLAKDRSFAVLVASDELRGMGGVEFLARASDFAPQAVRVLVSGTGSAQRASHAVNRGSVFRLLLRPLEPEILGQALHDAADEARRRASGSAEADVTARAVIELLGELLCTARPAAHAFAERLRERVVGAFAALGVPRQWEIETAATLSQVGWAILPRTVEVDELNSRAYEQVGKSVLELSAQMLRGIPRLERVREILLHQNIGTDKARSVKVPVVRLGVQVLGIALELERMVELGASEDQAREVLNACDAPVDPRLLRALSGTGLQAESAAAAALRKRPARRVSLGQLNPGQTLAEDVLSTAGGHLLIAGVNLTRSSIDRLRTYCQLGLLAETEVKILADPMEKAA